MFYVRLGESQENTTGRTPSKPLFFYFLFFFLLLSIYINQLPKKTREGESFYSLFLNKKLYYNYFNYLFIYFSYNNYFQFSNHCLSFCFILFFVFARIVIFNYINIFIFFPFFYLYFRCLCSSNFFLTLFLIYILFFI
jgi:hypothetical protein